MIRKVLIGISLVSTMSFASNLILNPEDYVLEKQLIKQEGESNEIYTFSEFSIAQYKLGYAQGMICGGIEDLEEKEKCFTMYDNAENNKFKKLKKESNSAYNYYSDYNLMFATKVSSSFMFSKANLEKIEKKYISKNIKQEEINFIKKSVKNIDAEAENMHKCFINYYKDLDPTKTPRETTKKAYDTCLK